MALKAQESLPEQVSEVYDPTTYQVRLKSGYSLPFALYNSLSIILKPGTVSQ